MINAHMTLDVLRILRAALRAIAAGRLELAAQFAAWAAHERRRLRP